LDLLTHFISQLHTDKKTLIRFGLTCRYLQEMILIKEKWYSLDYSQIQDLEEFYNISPFIGKFIETLELGTIKFTESVALQSVLRYCTGLQTLIFTNISCSEKFFPDVVKSCPNLTAIEVHEPQSEFLRTAATLLVKFSQINHLILAYENNYLHTQYIPETIHRVIYLLEKRLKGLAQNTEHDYYNDKTLQAWITLQYLYRRINDIPNANRIIVENGNKFVKLEKLQKMTDRILSGLCSRPKDTDTCYYWYHCYTCGLDGFSGLCGYCANGKCHKGHRTMFKYISLGAYCDCTKHNHKSIALAEHFLSLLSDREKNS